MKVFRFLIGLAIGAGVALLVAPKSGRELRRQLTGGGSSKLLGAGRDTYPEPAEWGGPATVVAEPPMADRVPPPLGPTWAPEPVAEEVVTEAEDKIVVEEPALEEEPAGEDLRVRIEETRAALENELAQPFAAAASEQADEAALMAGAAAAAEVAAEDAVVDAVAAEAVAEEAVAEAEVAEVIAEEAVYEAVVADEVATDSVIEALAADDEQVEIAAEEAVIEAADSEAVAEEAVTQATEEELAAEAAEEADVAEHAAEEAIVEEIVVDEAVAEAPPVAEEPAPFAGPLPPPPLVPSGPAVAESEPAAERPVASQARDIDYGEQVHQAAEEVVEVAAAEESVTEAPVVEAEPVIEEEPAPAPVVEAEPVVVEEPVAAPAEQAPAVDAAVAREGGAIDQAEMRRRIEETRARLKAKAFDAMMSGEAALLSRDSGERAVPTGEEHGLDEETDSAIDESLSQEEY